MEKLVPLISSAQTGPLGVPHLPRFWLKLRAYDAGILAEGYAHGEGGTDVALLRLLELEPDRVVAYVRDARPDYIALERWLVEAGARLDPTALADFANLVATYPMSEPRLTDWSRRFGIEPGTVPSACAMNQLDDWWEIHRQVTQAGAASSPIVPAIGPGVSGPLGLIHFPRMWLKHLLHAAGRMADGYLLCRGLDRVTATELGFPCPAFTDFVAAERPDYVAAERWLKANAANTGPEGIASANAALRALVTPAETADKIRARAGLGPGVLDSVTLNAIDDWFALHDQLSAIAV